MIGGGGKIGGPGGHIPVDVPTPLPTETPAQGKSPVPVTRPPGDHFEKASGRAASNKPAAFSSEQSATNDVIRMARENPAQAKQLVASMRAQIDRNAQKLQAEMAGAQGALQQLANERFTKKALAEKSEELRRRRAKIGSMKTRLQLSQRKLALLQQLAGKLGSPGIDADLERILDEHDQLSSNWSRRQHLLSIAELFFGNDEDTPAHLREVVKADVVTGSFGDEVGDALQQVSPRRVIAELVARTLDGSTAPSPPSTPGAGEHANPGVMLGAQGEHGPTLKSWSMVGDLMTAALERDPFKGRLGGEG